MTAVARATIRPAREGDCSRISELVAHLGFDIAPELLRANLATLTDRGLPPFVAEADGVVGCISLSIMHVLHRRHPVGRLSMLIVAPASRGIGIGRALVEHSMHVLRQAGCSLCEVTSNHALVDAHRFYERLGFQQTSIRLARNL